MSKKRQTAAPDTTQAMLWYVTSGLKVTEIARKLGISPVTLTRHARLEGWDKLREQHRDQQKRDLLSLWSKEIKELRSAVQRTERGNLCSAIAQLERMRENLTDDVERKDGEPLEQYVRRAERAAPTMSKLREYAQARQLLQAMIYKSLGIADVVINLHDTIPQSHIDITARYGGRPIDAASRQASTVPDMIDNPGPPDSPGPVGDLPGNPPGGQKTAPPAPKHHSSQTGYIFETSDFNDDEPSAETVIRGELEVANG